MLIAVIGGSCRAALPGFAQVKESWHSSETLMLDRQGTPLQEIRRDLSHRRTEWVALETVSPALIGAVLHAEDRRFEEHAGVDWLAAGKAALTNWLRDRPRGASTLSMQLAGLLDPDLRARAGRRDLGEKWRQLRAAQALERSWSKTQILEAYLNLLPLRGELTGLDAASRGLFDKRPAGLDHAEALILAALIRSPNAPPAQVAERVCALARDLPSAPDCKTLRRRTLNALSGRYPILPAVDLASHAALKALAERTGPAPAEIRTSLDAGLQRRVRKALADQLVRLAPRNVQDAAALVVDNASGRVLAYASVSGPRSASPHSDGVLAPRQAGSTLKPFLYALALDRRLLTAASPLSDDPVLLGTAGGQYAPRNYDHSYRGLASLRTALAGSLNIPAVQTAQLVGLEAFAERLHLLGFGQVTEAADFYGPALALGSVEVNLWELVNAYRTLANGGRGGSLSLGPDAVEARPGTGPRIFSAEAAWLVAHILSDRQARAATFGLESPLATPYWSAVKTGTSKDMRDNWCVGFTAAHTVGVWIGNFSGEPMHDVSGMHGAAPVWAGIMDSLHAERAAGPPRRPYGLVAASVQPPGEPPRREWFLAGTVPEAAGWQRAHPPARILEPAEGGIYALDQDIPRPRQILRFTAENPPAGATWRLDGWTLDGGDWPPVPGRHELQLLDRQGRELDRVRFEVRG
ncbi:MAG TPA: penicillin-binding protein 1C [Thiobacillaceae bacterium]|nr:penicillin-binding protein 1C [Thiobacillaceae bacterium]